MVCEMTLPPWVPLFSIAGAVVADVGGVLSHCAIVAREFGVPAVVGPRSPAPPRSRPARPSPSTAPTASSTSTAAPSTDPTPTFSHRSDPPRMGGKRGGFDRSSAGVHRLLSRSAAMADRRTCTREAARPRHARADDRCGMSERTRVDGTRQGRRADASDRPRSPVAPTSPSSHEQRLLAAALAAARRRHLALRAADLLGVDASVRGFVELSVQQHRNISSRAAAPSHRRPEPSTDVTTLGPIPVTTHTRTLVDLGAVSLSSTAVRHALSNGSARGHVTVPRAGAGDPRSCR